MPGCSNFQSASTACCGRLAPRSDIAGQIARATTTSRTAAAHMIAVVAEEMDGGLQYKLGDGVLVLGAVLPEPEGMIG